METMATWNSALFTRSEETEASMRELQNGLVNSTSKKGISPVKMDYACEVVGTSSKGFSYTANLTKQTCGIAAREILYPRAIACIAREGLDQVDAVSNAYKAKQTEVEFMWMNYFRSQ